MTPCGPLVGLRALMGPTGASKSRLFAAPGLHLGSLWAARGVIWTPFGELFGTFACKKASFLPCDVQAHFLHHFGRLFTPFWWYFGELFDGLGLPNRKRISKSRNPREYTFFVRFS